MNIRLFRIYSVPIRISSLEFHVPGTCLFIIWRARSHHVPLHKVGRHVATTCFSMNEKSMGWHVAAMCHLRKLFIFLCIRGGTYIYVPIYVHTIKIHEILHKMFSFKSSRGQFGAGTILNSCLMGLGCPLLLGSSARRLRRCAATLPRLLERTLPGSTFFSVLLEAAG